MNTDMESIAQLAGVKAKETDKVSVEFTRDEVEDLLEALSWEYIDPYTNLAEKLKNANPDWEF